MCLFSLISINQLFSQISSDQQKKLEAQRTKLMNEIKQINNLLFSNTKIRKNAIDEVEDIQVRLNVRSELINRCDVFILAKYGSPARSQNLINFLNSSTEIFFELICFKKYGKVCLN